MAMDDIPLYQAEDFDGMRRAGRLAAGVLDYLTPAVEPGVTTERLDQLAHQFILDHGAEPACLGYKGYPKTICTSVNHVVCHGIPSDKRLAEGDIVNIDVTVILDGWYGDTSRMFGVGEKIPIKAQRLMDVTHECLRRGIAAAKPGNHFGDIGHAIQTYAEAERFSVVRDFCGHGIGCHFHTPPNVLHYGQPGKGPMIKEGMFFTIEPMINSGGWKTKILADGWTAVTRDRSLSAQWEHSLGIGPDGAEIFTVSEN